MRSFTKAPSRRWFTAPLAAAHLSLLLFALQACGGDDSEPALPSYPGARAQDVGRAMPQMLLGKEIAKLRSPKVETMTTKDAPAVVSAYFEKQLRARGYTGEVTPDGQVLIHNFRQPGGAVAVILVGVADVETLTGLAVPQTVQPGDTVILAVTGMPDATNISAAAADWLKQNAIPIASAAPTTPASDLAGLKALVGNAKMVGLGEATHGTREFFQLKHRFLEYLVRELGFTTFAIEGNLPEARLIDAYVQGGPGDARKLMAGMHMWMWRSEEVVELVEWMRVYNSTAPAGRRVSLTGFDMQVSSKAIEDVLAFITAFDPARIGEVTARFTPCFAPFSDKLPNEPAPLSAPEVARCAADLKRTREELESSEVAYAAAASKSEAAWIVREMRVIEQAYAMQQTTGIVPSVTLRDAAMAENAEWLLSHGGPGTKVVLWGHNGHIAKYGSVWEGMGEVLKKKLASDYVSLGFAFSKGSFTANSDAGLGTFSVGAPPPEAYESFFASAGLPIFLLDLRGSLDATPAADWLTEPRIRREASAAFGDDSDGLEAADLSKEYDLLVYVHETSASRLYEVP
jgi:erythromycin esterase